MWKPSWDWGLGWPLVLMTIVTFLLCFSVNRASLFQTQTNHPVGARVRAMDGSTASSIRYLFRWVRRGHFKQQLSAQSGEEDLLVTRLTSEGACLCSRVGELDATFLLLMSSLRQMTCRFSPHSIRACGELLPSRGPQAHDFSPEILSLFMCFFFSLPVFRHLSGCTLFLSSVHFQFLSNSLMVSLINDCIYPFLVLISIIFNHIVAVADSKL